MTETNLAQAVEAAGSASRYDTNVKYLLADKQILYVTYDLRTEADGVLSQRL